MTGTSVDLTYTNASGDTEQQRGVRLPWEYAFTGTVGDVYISAQDNGRSGMVTATIWINDHVYKQAKSTGAYVIATASGTVE